MRNKSLMFIFASQLFTIELYVAALLSNSWFTIGVKPSQLQNQTTNETLTRLHYGLLYMCAWPSGAWLWDSGEKCFMLLRSGESLGSKRNASRPGLLATRLNDKYLLDIEPRRMAQSQLLAFMGSACLLLAAILALIMLTTCRPMSGHLSAYMQALLALHILELAPRLASLIVFTVTSRDYLSYLLRSSYRAYTDIDFGAKHHASLIEKRLSNYELSPNWPYWLAVASMATTTLGAIIACNYLTFDYRKAKKKTSAAVALDNDGDDKPKITDRLLQQTNNSIASNSQLETTQNEQSNSDSISNIGESDQSAHNRSVYQTEAINKTNEAARTLVGAYTGSRLLRKRSSSWNGLQSYQIAYSKENSQFCVKIRRYSTISFGMFKQPQGNESNAPIDAQAKL
jgi:hypothetical protein